MQLLGHLASGLPAPDDEHAAGRETIRARIAIRVDHQKPGRKIRRWAMWPLERSGREHDCIGTHLPLGGVHDEPATWVRAEGSDVDPIEDRGLEALRIAFEMDHDFVPGHEAVGVLACVVATRQLHVPVGCHQAEAVPAVAPALPHGSPLEHDVVDPARWSS